MLLDDHQNEVCGGSVVGRDAEMTRIKSKRGLWTVRKLIGTIDSGWGYRKIETCVELSFDDLDVPNCARSAKSNHDQSDIRCEMGLFLI